MLDQVPTQALIKKEKAQSEVKSRPTWSDLAHVKPEITYTWEKFSEGAQEALPLMKRHFEEVYDFKDKFGFNPQWSYYFELERQGCLHILAVRAAGTLIGYIGIILLPMLHTQSCLRARGDSFYLDPLYRGGLIAMRMFKAAEMKMKELGVNRLEWVSKRPPKKDSGPIFERLGFQCVEYVWAKILE